MLSLAGAPKPGRTTVVADMLSRQHSANSMSGRTTGPGDCEMDVIGELEKSGNKWTSVPDLQARNLHVFLKF